MSELAKVQILLHEYDTLRAELLERHASLFHFYGFTTIAAVLLLTFFCTDGGRRAARWLLALLGSVILAATVVINSDTVRLSKRIRQVEAEVNIRSGETLLRWESEWGWGRRAGRLFPPHSGSH
jgi:hypothetical protein